METLRDRPGFRFHPNDREIINDYLLKKMDGNDFNDVIREIDLCRYEPWELPGISVLEDDKMWYFFCRPDYKYKKSKRLQRTTKAGRWKPTGKVRPIRGHGGEEIGTKRTLVFHSIASTGSVRGKTTWVIHEYQVHNVLHGQKEFVFCKLKEKEGEQNNISTGQEVKRGVQEDIAHHQQAQDASSTGLNLYNLSRIESNPTTSDGLSSEDRLQIERLPFEDSDDQVDPSFIDSLLVEPEEPSEEFVLVLFAVSDEQVDPSEDFLLDPSDYQQQSPDFIFMQGGKVTESDIGHSEYLEQIGSSRMNGKGNAEGPQDPEELESLRSLFEKFSVIQR